MADADAAGLAKPRIVEFPNGSAGDVAASYDVSGDGVLEALPEDINACRVSARGCTRLESVPDGMECNELDLAGTAIRALPDRLNVRYRLNLSQCLQLEELPAGLQVGALDLRGCRSLRSLPNSMSVTFLDLEGCTELSALPENLGVSGGRLSVRDCIQLRELPAGLGPLSQLDISGCELLSDLPDDLFVSSWIDLAGSGMTGLPSRLQRTQIRWRGVPVEPRVAFQPETITAEEALREPNVELRRVLVERLGFERLLTEARADVLHEDRDAGGERKLMRVCIPGDDHLVCVVVRCPTTDRQFIIRVPPQMTSCPQAAAWIAGFDDPKDYEPVLET